jgi:hypothetical protein
MIRVHHFLRAKVKLGKSWKRETGKRPTSSFELGVHGHSNHVSDRGMFETSDQLTASAWQQIMEAVAVAVVVATILSVASNHVMYPSRRSRDWIR